MRKVLLLEFNEICPPLLDRWMAEGKLPNFAALHARSQVFTTEADEHDPANLEPWIQWYSIHTGLPFREHKVFRLTDGPRSPHEDLWLRLQAAGKSVMNCSSMNARGISGERAFFLPDPWCTTEAAFPPELAIFKEVVSRSVQEYSRGDSVLSWRQLTNFVTFLTAHGLSPATVSAILTQFASERVAAGDVKWKRVTLLDRLQFDLFKHYYRRLRPDFATFFINSTAHLQHAYWRHMDPGAFVIRPSAQELADYGDAVLYGYQAMDRLLRDFAALTERDTVVILCSALSQQPYLKRENEGGQRFYRLRDVEAFLGMVGITPVMSEPVMTHQYLVRFANAAAASDAATALQAIRVGGEQVFAAVVSDNDSLYVGCKLFKLVPDEAMLTGLRNRNDPLPFFDHLYLLDGTKSGRHHPDGVLWIGHGTHHVHPGKVSILDIAPTIYELLGTRPPARLPGASLLPRYLAEPVPRVA